MQTVILAGIRYGAEVAAAPKQGALEYVKEPGSAEALNLLKADTNKWMRLLETQFKAVYQGEKCTEIVLPAAEDTIADNAARRTVVAEWAVRVPGPPGPVYLVIRMPRYRSLQGLKIITILVADQVSVSTWGHRRNVGHLATTYGTGAWGVPNEPSGN